MIVKCFPLSPFFNVLPGDGKVCSGEPRFKRGSHPHSPWPSGQMGHFLLTRGRFPVTHAGIHLLTKTAPPSLLINRKPEDVELEKRIKFQALPPSRENGRTPVTAPRGRGGELNHTPQDSTFEFIAPSQKRVYAEGRPISFFSGSVGAPGLNGVQMSRGIEADQPGAHVFLL